MKPIKRRLVSKILADETPKPEPQKRERVAECCARCRRGIKAFGSLPCGYDGRCKCHCTEAERNYR